MPIMRYQVSKSTVATMAEGSISTSDFDHIFGMVYLTALLKKLYRMITFETTMTLANLSEV